MARSGEVVGATSSLEFKGNVTIKHDQNEFKYRSLKSLKWNIGASAGTAFCSKAVDVKKKSFTRDVLYGVGYAGLETPPTGYLCFYDSDVEWDWTGSFNYANVSVHQAAGFVAKVPMES